MKILYAVQATGNGHISRAVQLTPYLQKLGTVDIFLSGQNYTLPIALPIKYKSRGLSLFYGQHGGLSLSDIVTKNSWGSVLRQAKDLPVEKYDIVLNDFEPITAQACRIKNKSSIQLSHQASFRSRHAPRPDARNPFGEWIFRSYATSTKYIGLHFMPYDDYILPPIIKQSILKSDPIDEGHITIYMSGYPRSFFEYHLSPLKDLKFHCFLPNITQPIHADNLTFYPIDETLFNHSLVTCHGMVTGGGFETPSEALFLKKKLMCIPIRNHYEQYCNAAALSLLGVHIVYTRQLDDFSKHIRSWLDQRAPEVSIARHNIEQTVLRIADHAA